MKKQTTSSTKKGVSKGKVAAGMAAAAAIGAGAYYLMGPNGKKNQKKAKVLASKIKKGAIAQAKKYESEYEIAKDKAKKIAARAIEDAKKELREAKNELSKRNK